MSKSSTSGRQRHAARREATRGMGVPGETPGRPLVEPENIIDTLARDVKAARAKYAISLPDAAKSIGISVSALTRIESGKSRNCRGETFFQILYWAHGLGYSEFAGFTVGKAAD